MTNETKTNGERESETNALVNLAQIYISANTFRKIHPFESNPYAIDSYENVQKIIDNALQLRESYPEIYSAVLENYSSRAEAENQQITFYEGKKRELRSEEKGFLESHQSNLLQYTEICKKLNLEVRVK